MMNDKKLLQVFRLTEDQLNAAVEHYKATGQVLNRAVAIKVGLADPYY